VLHVFVGWGRWRESSKRAGDGVRAAAAPCHVALNKVAVNDARPAASAHVIVIRRVILAGPQGLACLDSIRGGVHARVVRPNAVHCSSQVCVLEDVASNVPARVRGNDLGVGEVGSVQGGTQGLEV
jgi:hypothetical protein